ncbi:PREDICTED: uncharacterized zinc protease RF_0338-like [Rhagoletis zephyria]|uniref:uncharacterized zinc protease RF_0338-like n=1 Tax=Rhagoletis zephyria TaxID=28612 RepID=UPI0008119BC4|nr:PREDICTED: uncharacterized zinc protease RF_0338-like [Rhagoletis zephyria]
MSFSLPELPYDQKALEPYISAKTLDFHYNKHHKGYLDKLNTLVKEKDHELKELIKKVHGDNNNISVFNNAAQVWNHTFYWNSMKKNGGGKPREDYQIAKKIKDDLGGFEKFNEMFSEHGINQFGSGWVWLVLENNKLKITKTPNADLPLIHNQIPLLTMDVWEHAYYLDCQNRFMIQVTKLNNGLRVITEYMSEVDSVAINMRVNVGSRAESVDQNGVSHFLEHMAFKGTKSRTALEIAKAFDDIGGVFNACTGRESTTYYAKVLKKDVPIGIDILTDILINSTFPEDELEREKGVVIQEIFQTNDSPSDIIFDKYMEAAYNNQSFGRSILGTQETVKSFTREKLNSYINEHYFGENMILAVAGNIEHEKIVALVKDTLSNIHSKKKIQNESANYTGGEYREHRKLDQVHLLIGWPSVSCHDHSYSDSGMLSVFAGTDSSNLDKLLQSITAELKKLSTNDLKEDEVNRVKERVKSQILMSRESTHSRAETLSYYYANYGKYISKDELIKKISAVSHADIKAAAEELLSQHEKTTLAAIGEINSLPNYDKVISMLKI